MPLYQYVYVDGYGKHRTGLMDAQSDIDAKMKLREQGILVTKISAKTKMSTKQNLKGETLLTFTIQLSQLINAGVPLYEGLKAVEEQSRGEPYHRVILSICEQIRTGMSLSNAMAAYPESFDKLYCGMVAAGEAVGVLGPVLEKLSSFLAKQMKLKQQISTALIYPGVLGSFALLIIGLLLGFVVPSLEGIFAERKLNAFTNAVLGLSHIFRDYWWLYIPVIVGFIVWSFFKIRSPAGKIWIQAKTLHIPVLKNLVAQAALTRFCRTLATLLEGGLSMIESLRIARSVMNNAVMEKEIASAETKIIEGHSLSQELARSKYVPKMVTRMLAVGEESGTSVAMLGRIADMYEYELEKTLDRVMALAQPLILIVMGLVIGTVLLAVLLPLTDVSSFS